MPNTRTLKQAEAARSQHSAELAKLGAHAIGVEELGSGWAVVAHVEPGQAFDGPQTLKTQIGGRMVDVPLKVLRADIAEPE